MQLSSNTVLVTGGASGIGLAFARRFLAAGSAVVICGRREQKLREAAAANAGLRTHVCDLSQQSDRVHLAESMRGEFPTLNVLVNNAGIQRKVRLAGQEPWDDAREEIATNLEAPIHLTRLFIPHLLQQPRAAIINVTSGLAFAPRADTPIYSATKAALHSFTLSLRHQLARTSIQTIEIIPPALDTDLGGPGLHTFGANVDEFADAVFARLSGDEVEIGYGFAEGARNASRAELDQIAARINAGQ
jgi:uncharacterized oxidoreductase